MSSPLVLVIGGTGGQGVPIVEGNIPSSVTSRFNHRFNSPLQNLPSMDSKFVF